MYITDFLSNLITFMFVFIAYMGLFIAISIIGAFIIGPTRFFRNDTTGHLVMIRKGFSFTYLFFGFWVPLFRNDWKSFFICLGIDILSLGIGRFVMVFLLNRMYITKLEKDGYIEVIPHFEPLNPQV